MRVFISDFDRTIEHSPLSLSSMTSAILPSLYLEMRYFFISSAIAIALRLCYIKHKSPKTSRKERPRGLCVCCAGQRHAWEGMSSSGQRGYI